MDNYEESWGPIHSHKSIPPLSKVSEIALSRLQSRPIAKLSGWLANLIEDPDSEAHQTSRDTWLPQRYALIEASARSWIDQFFIELAPFVWELNNSTASERIRIVIENAKSTFELECKRDSSSEPYKFTCYQGHLSGHNWTMLLRSYFECVQVFILQSEMTLAMELNQVTTDDLKPIAEFHATVNSDSVQWALEGVTVSKKDIPAMARELFADFICLEAGKLSESDLHLLTASQTGPDPDLSRKKEAYSSILSDLKVWQSRDLFSSAIRRDLDFLILTRHQPSLGFAIDPQLESLHTQLTELQSSWSTLLTTLLNIADDCA